MSDRDIGHEGLTLIIQYESFVPFVYDDLRPVRGALYGYREYLGGKVTGTLTIGYGHTNDAGIPVIKEGMRVTEHDALVMLHRDLQPIVKWLNAKKLDFNQGEFDAVCSFTFNCGEGNGNKLLAPMFKEWTTNEQWKEKVSDNFSKFIRAARTGQVLTGLVRRREAEQKLWASGYHDETTLPRTDHAQGGAGPAPVPTPVIVAGGVIGTGTVVAGSIPTPHSKVDAPLLITGGGLIAIVIVFVLINHKRFL